jgi:formate dehydrogenase
MLPSKVLSRNFGRRWISTRSPRLSTKVVSVLYDDPVLTGSLPPRDSIPKIHAYPDQAGKPGQLAPNPSYSEPFQGVKLLGSVSGELGLRPYLELNGHEYVVTSEKDGDDAELEKHLHDAEIIISQPFWPAYMTAERIARAPNLKMLITAGIGSDHVDLEAACARKLTVVEVTYCNSISVAEHVVMLILSLVRNYIPSYQHVVNGGWNIADCVQRSFDVEGMHVGTVAAGRIGLAVLRRMHPFDCHLHYTGTQAKHLDFMKSLCSNVLTSCTHLRSNRSTSVASSNREGVKSYVPQQCRGSRKGLRCGDDQLPTSSRDREPV